jgi:BirA family biotin operon repressor/biotin-[acetyl-CoA-carboxylase] ligase
VSDPWLVDVDSLPSTQDEARRIAGLGAPPFSVVITRHQTAGRGRHGRTWLSAPGEALTFSFLLPEAATGSAPAPVAVGLAVLEALAGMAGGNRSPFALKWPNDVVAGPARRKVAGVLVEAGVGGEPAVAGVGINVNGVPAGLEGVAGSLAECGLGPVDYPALALDIVGRTRRHLSSPRRNVLQAWRDCLTTLGESVAVRSPKGEVLGEGVAVDVAADGGLVLEASDGARRTFHGGEVTLTTAR